MNDKNLKNRLEEIKSLYELSKYQMAELGAMEESIFIPAINELSNAGEHILRASTSDDIENANNELDKAEAHCWRAISDGSEAGVIWSLEELRQFQEDYRLLPITEYVPAYKEIIKLAQKLQSVLSNRNSMQPSQYYMEVKELLPSMVERLSEINKTRDILNKELRVKQRSTKRWLVALFLGIIASIASNFIYEFVASESTQADGIQTEITNLAEIQSSLSKLQGYVVSQQRMGSGLRLTLVVNYSGFKGGIEI